MEYKGYKGYATYDSEAKIFHGEVVGLCDVVTFQGKNFKVLEQAFRDSVDDYIEFCSEIEKRPASRGN